MQQRRALVVRGGWDGHAPVEAAELFVPFLREHGFAVTVSDSLEVYADEDTMRATDLVVQCWTMGEILADELRGLRAAVAAGTGFAGWHGGVVDSFRMATDYLQMVGAQFAAHPGDVVEHTVDVRDAEHPITQGVASFSLRSEQYWLLTDPLNEVLATTTVPARADDPWHRPVTSPVVWTRRWGAGRIFVCTVGHQLADLEVPQVRTVVERGLLWSARG
ncbi:ThuA domain-containing protein [Cellulomonas sp. DKR-3]|uniref:ThuA domain-containing protein n=1 Tax=Cellulomonas fulva TaxID=2835530 RepID=A0ABS5U1T9_9CELL|nr:ThuA domain-containing protein [Cellulomonas fulva]MBT0995355.1 ThuA domain-containing protein [Cellulomonas fulva]